MLKEKTSQQEESSLASTAQIDRGKEKVNPDAGKGPSCGTTSERKELKSGKETDDAGEGSSSGTPKETESKTSKETDDDGEGPSCSTSPKNKDFKTSKETDDAGEGPSCSTPKKKDFKTSKETDDAGEGPSCSTSPKNKDFKTTKETDDADGGPSCSISYEGKYLKGGKESDEAEVLSYSTQEKEFISGDKFEDVAVEESSCSTPQTPKRRHKSKHIEKGEKKEKLKKCTEESDTSTESEMTLSSTDKPRKTKTSRNTKRAGTNLSTDRIEALRRERQLVLIDAVKSGKVEKVKKLIKDIDNVNAFIEDGGTLLHYAVHEGRGKIAQVLIENGANPNKRHLISNQTSVHVAVRKNRIKCLNILKKGGGNITLNEDYQFFFSPLHVALSLGLVEIVAWLLKHGVPVNVKSLSSDIKTPLMIAILSHNITTIRLLLSYGADANITGAFAPLVQAIKIGRHDIVEALLANGARVDVRVEHDKHFAVHYAALRGDIHVLELLRKAGANLGAASFCSVGYHPIHIAAQRNNVRVMEYLISRGISVNACDKKGSTPLFYAVHYYNVEAVRFLLTVKAKVKIHAHGLRHATPLHLAARNEGMRIWKILVDEGADLYAKDFDELTPIHKVMSYAKEAFMAEFNNIYLGGLICGDDTVPLILAAAYSQTDYAMNFLISRGSPLNLIDECGNTPLHIAAITNNVEIVRFLVKQKALLNIPTDENLTALHIATEQMNNEIVQCLISNGADINARDNLGYAAVHLAAIVGNTIFFEAVKNIEDVFKCRARDRVGNLPVHCAVKHDNFEALSWLLEHGGCLEYRNSLDYTPLLYATSLRKVHMVKYLLQKGADITAESSRRGVMAMHIAATKGVTPVIVPLLSMGADVNTTTVNSHNTPLFCATIARNFDTVRTLVLYGAHFTVEEKTELEDSDNRLNQSILEFLRTCGLLETTCA